MNRSFILAFILTSTGLYAQNDAKIIMHLQSADTLVHKSMVNQISNIRRELPAVQIEVVCHGPGLDFLKKDKETYADRIQKLNPDGVTFVGCEFTMQQKNVTRLDLVPFATTVPYGLVEIIRKQQEGWIYVKLGF